MLRGKGEVLRFLVNEGFGRLKAGGVDGKTRGEGCTFVQPMGPNSVPRDAGQADFDGGRATRYKFDRATQVRPQSMLESRRSATGRSFAD